MTGAGQGGRGLNRALADAGLGGLRRQLGYKTSYPAGSADPQDGDRPSARRGCLTMSTHIRSRDGNGDRLPATSAHRHADPGDAARANDLICAPQPLIAEE
jgi:hypothetical protein